MRVSADDPDVIQVSFFAPPGILVAGPTLKAIEQSFSRQEFRRVSPAEIGDLTYPARATESYVQELLAKLDRDAIRSRGFRIVLNYGLSAASLVIPSLIGELGVEMVALNAFVDCRRSTPHLVDTARALDDTTSLVQGRGRRPGRADRQPGRASVAGRRAQRTRSRPRRRCSCSCASWRPRTGGGRLLVPINESRMVEEIADGPRAAIVERTKASLGDLLAGAAAERRRVRRRLRRRLRVPGASCPPTTPSCRSGSCSSWWRTRAGRCRSWSRTCPEARSCTSASRAHGRPRAWRCAS